MPDSSANPPNLAALRAAAAEPVPEAPLIRLDSAGVVLIYGRDERAIEVGGLLKEHLDVTVLIKPPVMRLPTAEFPVAQGRIRAAKGYLGAFELTVDEFALPSAQIEPPRDGAVSRCDIFLDLSGSLPLFPAAHLRDGYLRPDPDSPTAVSSAVLHARDLVGIFDKPRYVSFHEHLCAHSRSRIVGCTRCLDLCPTGAITPAGDHVSVDPYICSGCGQCAAACPTGAAAYALPPLDALMRKLRTLLLTFREAGGEQAIVLLHDEGHGAPLIAALGSGLPANVLPLSVNEVTQVGLEVIAAIFAHGASAVRLLLRAKPRHDISGLTHVTELAGSILSGLGFEGQRVAGIETDDPEELASALRAVPTLPPSPRPSSFLAAGEKRGILRFALDELQRAAPAPVELLNLPVGAPFGAVELDTTGCTLCLACVSACPTGALIDDPQRPVLRFAEDACVQCGLCKATCPEKVITLKPRLHFHSGSSPGARVLKEEEPFCCMRCGKPFGVRSTIERIVAKLEGKHWMFAGDPKRLDLIRMCEDCRVAFVTEREFDPHAVPRPPARTTDDYLREREMRGLQKK